MSTQTHSPEDTGSRLCLGEGVTQRITPPGPRPSPVRNFDEATTVVLNLSEAPLFAPTGAELAVGARAFVETPPPPPRPLPHPGPPPVPAGQVVVPVERPNNLREYLARRSVLYVVSPERARRVPRHRRASWLARRFGGKR